MKYKVNIEALDTWTPESVYILGYIYAKGSISSSTLSINGTDLDLLHEIREGLGSDHKISQTFGNGYVLRIYSKEMVDKVESLGLGTNKFEDLRMPQFPREYMSHFVRGYFDGKGSFMIEKGRRVVCNISCGSAQFLEDLRDELVLLGLRRSLVHQSGVGHSTNYIRYYISDTKKLVDLMYKDATIYSKVQQDRYKLGI